MQPSRPAMYSLALEEKSVASRVGLDKRCQACLRKLHQMLKERPPTTALATAIHSSQVGLPISHSISEASLASVLDCSPFQLGFNEQQH